MGKKDVKTTQLDPHVDAIFYWRGRLWTQETQSGDVTGYDEVDINAVNYARLSGDADVLGLRRSLVASHQGTSCLRTIDFGDERESPGSSRPLTPNPTAAASDGKVAAIADRSLALLTIARDGVPDGTRTYVLPLKDMRITGVAIADDWVALDDASESRVVVIRRRDLGQLEQKKNGRLKACS
jgi:hypothetical protein